jgi:integrase
MVLMNEIALPWERFAFDAESAWGRAVLNFLREKYERSGSQCTLDHYRQALTVYFSDPAKLPDRYTREDVERFLHLPGQALGRVGDAPKIGTINNRLSILSSWYKFVGSYSVQNAATGEPEPLMTRMPPTAGLRQMQREKPPYKALSADELRRLFAAIPRDATRGIRDFAIFTVYFFTARRRSEIVSLTWGDLEQAKLIEAGGGRRSGWLYHYRSKGHKRQDATAEMPQIAMDAILAYLDASGKRKTIQASDPIFTTVPGYIGQHGYDPKRPLSSQAVYSAVKRYAKAAGLDARVSVHSLRHTSARIRYENGSDIREIQRILGHTSLAVTDVYLRELTTTSDPASITLAKQFENL